MDNTLNMQPMIDLGTLQDFKVLAGYLDEAIFNDIMFTVDTETTGKRLNDRIYYLRELRNAILKIADCDFSE